MLGGGSPVKFLLIRSTARIIAHSLPHLGGHPGLNVVVLGVGDLGAEAEHGANLHRQTEPDVVHAHAHRPLPRKDHRVRKPQLVGLPWQTKNKVKFAGLFERKKLFFGV